MEYGTVPFLDLRVNDPGELDDLIDGIKGVLHHGRLINGPELLEFEQKVARFCGRRFAVGVGSGTDALFLGLKSLGIGPGDEVITTSLSWIATANSISMTGATPVFADILEDLNIDPASAEHLITEKTRAILPVHYTGRVCDMDRLKDIAERHSLLLIEDAAQAFSAERNGKRAGSFGDMACFSMNPMKIYAACGEAGVILTDDEKVHQRLLALRYNGTIKREVLLEPGTNSRMDTIQAAILLRRLPRLKSIVERRRAWASIYNASLADVVGIPLERANEFQVYYTYTIQADRRDQLKGFLHERGVETKIQHRVLMPEQGPYLESGRDALKNARRIVKSILSIPVNEKLKKNQIEHVARLIRDFYGR